MPTATQVMDRSNRYRPGKPKEFIEEDFDKVEEHSNSSRSTVRGAARNMVLQSKAMNQ
jgi:hypothetical protein